jgi:hypothetical protein
MPISTCHEAYRKNIENSLGVLQSRFSIRSPVGFWDDKPLNNIMIACLILHNMIIQGKMCLDLVVEYDNVGSKHGPDTKFP